MDKQYNPENKKRVTVFLEPTVVYRARSRAMMEAKTLSEVTNELLEKYGNEIVEAAVNASKVKDIKEILDETINKPVSSNPQGEWLKVTK